MALGLVATMLMSNATTVLADNFSTNQGETKDVTTWKTVNTDLFSNQDSSEQAKDKTTEDDNWKMLSGAEGTATFVNTSNPTSLTVELQENATLKNVDINVYQILGIVDEDEDGYSYALMEKALRTFFENYFSSITETGDAKITKGLDSLKTQEQKNAFSVALAQYIEDNDINPVQTYTGQAGEKSHTFDLSRQYTYTEGADDPHEYTLGKGYYFITRSDAIDDTYTLRVLDAEDTTITLKGTTPSLSKSGDDVVMGVGDTVNYTLQSKLTYSQGANYKYIIYDHLENTMTPNLDNLQVTVGDISLVRGVDYTVAQTTYEDDEDIDGNDETDEIPVIAITLKFDQNSRLYNDAYVGKDVIVTYSATMTKTATTGNDTMNGHENYNKAWLKYGEETTIPVEWDVYTIALEISKTDYNDNALANAEFALYASTDTAKTNAYRFSKTTDASGKEYYYLDNTKGISTLTSNADGKIEIRGLDEGSYILSETKAPAGYQVVADQVLTIDAGENITQDSFTTLSAETTGKDSTTINDTNVADGYVTMQIKDPAQGSDDLPATGGTGRIIIYVIGSLLLIGSATGYVVSRKKYTV